jgi:peptide/nickel transport system substrate-binding protein
MSGRPDHHLPAQPEAPPEFKNVKVRQAIVYAINNEGIVKKIMKGTATPPARSPKGYAGYNPNLTPRYDLEKAKQLMKEAGLCQRVSSAP